MKTNIGFVNPYDRILEEDTRKKHIWCPTA